MTYESLSVHDLHGTTLADYLVSLDATLEVAVAARIPLVEPGFPVVELARELASWLHAGTGSDFVFDSMSYEIAGALMFRRTVRGWAISSSLQPDSTSNAEVNGEDLEAACRRLISHVRDDLTALGADPAEVLGL